MKYDLQLMVVIVLYKIKLSESKSFLSLTASLKENNVKLDILVYDNSPEFNQEEDLQLHQNWNIIYKADTKNSGVSKAYNTGAKLGAAMGKKWLLIVDQDTFFPLQTINQYLSGINKYADKKLLAPIMLIDEKRIVSPSHFKFMRGFYASSAEAGINTFNGRSLINSGMCINLDAFEKNNGYNEKLQLDFSDHDFIKRFKKNVTNEFVVVNLKVYHELSTETKNSLKSDLNRFGYYLDGVNKMDASVTERLFLKLHAFLRALKLSVQHKDSVFIKQIVKHNVIGNGSRDT